MSVMVVVSSVVDCADWSSDVNVESLDVREVVGCFVGGLSRWLGEEWNGREHL